MYVRRITLNITPRLAELAGDNLKLRAYAELAGDKLKETQSVRLLSGRYHLARTQKNTLSAYVYY